MVSRSPPLNSLRTFEVAARHLSFTRAAEELNVTQAAVSHQIRALEERLGLKLFHRGSGRIRLTAEGQRYLPGIRSAFETINEATERLLSADSRGTLTVTTLPSFAARWLVPRLGSFTARHPEIDVRIAPSVHRVDFTNEDVDLGIRYGTGDYPGLRSTRLMSEDIAPMCSPSLLHGPAALREPGDLARHTLLHEDGNTDWRNWLMATGVSAVDWTRGPIFLDGSMLIQAAVAGQGVALGRGVLARDELRAGRLVQPFERSLPAEYAYYVVCLEESFGRHKVSAFRDWLLNQALLDQASAESGVLAEAATSPVN
jgi:LysR family glycine cleavage system transcriptional activator